MSNSPCQDARFLALLPAYLAGELDARETEEVRDWLAFHADDPEVERLLLGWFESICDAEGRGASRIRRRNLAYVAAAVAVALPLGFLFGKKQSAEPAPVAWTDIRVPASEQREVTLSDGSTFKLMPGSRLTCPEVFTGPERQVFFEGEMLADIAPDPARPFIIRSDDVTVAVHGTSFDFKAYDDTRLVELTLLSGAVDLQVSHEGDVRSVLMSPGDIVHFDRKEGAVSLTKGSRNEMSAVSGEGVLSFLDIPLGDIAADLERHFGRHVVVAGDEIAAKRFFGIFSNGEGLEEILDALDPLNSTLAVSRIGDGFVISGAKSE